VTRFDESGRSAIGGTASLLQAALYIIAVGAMALAPSQQLTGPPSLVAAGFLANPWPLRVMSAAMVLCGLLGLGAVVPATVALFPQERTGWPAFGRNVAVLCLSVTIVYYTWLLFALPERAALSQARDAMSTCVLAASTPAVPLSWVACFTFGGMGIWVVIVAVLARRRAVLPRGFTVVCAIKTLGFWTILAGILSGNLVVTQVGAVVGGLIGGPLYHVWIGVVMRRHAQSASAGSACLQGHTARPGREGAQPGTGPR